MANYNLFEKLSYLLLMIMTILMLNHSNITIASTVKSCTVNGFDIICDCKQIDLNLRPLLMTNNVKTTSMVKFNRLIIKNCTFEHLNKETLMLAISLHTIIFDHVHIHQVANDSFKHLSMIDNFVHRNSEKLHCPRFITGNNSTSDYLIAINSLAKLNFLGICANNDNDTIPTGAFSQLKNIEQIYFYGNFSSYTIETNAFANLNNLISIVFHEVNFSSIKKNAFNLKNTKINVLNQFSLLKQL